MDGLLQLISNVDIAMFHFLNGFAGNRTLDYCVSFEEGSNIFKGGLFLATFWYFWCRAGSDQNRRRREIIAILAGALFALVACRLLASVTPFRVRPIYDVHIQHHPYAFPISSILLNWSAFPSDHAGFFFALAYGLACLSRRLTIPGMLYVSVWICLPRMFLGLHYMSDIVVGAVTGIIIMKATLRTGWLQRGFAARILSLEEANPKVFYGAAFLLSFEMGGLFEDVRLAGRTVFHVACEESSLIHAGLAAFAILVVLVITAYLLLPVRRYGNRSRQITTGPN